MIVVEQQYELRSVSLLRLVRFFFDKLVTRNRRVVGEGSSQVKEGFLVRLVGQFGVGGIPEVDESLQSLSHSFQGVLWIAEKKIQGRGNVHENLGLGLVRF